MILAAFVAQQEIWHVSQRVACFLDSGPIAQRAYGSNVLQIIANRSSTGGWHGSAPKALSDIRHAADDEPAPCEKAEQTVQHNDGGYFQHQPLPGRQAIEWHVSVQG